MDQNENIHGSGRPVKLLVFSASLRSQSFNTTLARLAARTIQNNNGIVDYADAGEFDCPSFNQDYEAEGRIPSGAIALRDRILSNDGFVIASPEYNGSMPGHLKNVIDWVSRFKPQPFHEHHAFLMSASPSMMGGNRALWQLRVPLEHLGTRVYPSMFSLATAHKSFDATGTIADAGLQQRFDATIVAFMQQVEASIHYPCIKKAWVEFLGERIDPVTDRVE